MRFRFAFLLTSIVVVAGACANPPLPPEDSSSADSASTGTIESATGSESDSEPPPTLPVLGDPSVRIVEIASFDRPVDLAFRRNDATMFIVEQGGRVVTIDGVAKRVVADLSDRLSSGTEQGLLALEFSSDGAYAYLYYTNRDGHIVVAEYPVASDGTIGIAAERILMTIAKRNANHNGGDLEIGPDGMLFISTGDGGGVGDPDRNSSNKHSLLGKLLRIDPTPTGGAPYTIPSDNPFANGAGGAAEVWAWGLRNPWRIAFDPTSGDLWIADVGQYLTEEINRVAPSHGVAAGRGVDFGWSAFEGSDRFNTDVTDPGTFTFPVHTYEHSDTACSISGGVVYRGSLVDELEPAYVYGDWCSRDLWAFEAQSGRNVLLLEGLDQTVAVRLGPDGEIYILELTGSVYRLGQR